ncbi:hypothetical protein N657DRAFT_632691 [Parathielavia appendiculata]|uniref:Uncharacterized protein n=1 Tax=Parathielavia appendiculata TaxID=2587402 RepID=A0AAN6U1P5_9PEZI|nr:hypothetical protein N657DRAFT_632691 [Parathielavia appendiculata]
MAQTWARFCPNLDIVQYREALSNEKKPELDRRANKLARGRAPTNCTSLPSLAGKDKRPYEFVRTDDSGQRTVETRIPDATLGLTTFDDYFLERCFGCAVRDCKDAHGERQPDLRLSQDRLRDMMHNPQCGLAVDGVGGRRTSSSHMPPTRLKSETYLAMLDDLVRDPDNVAEYQTADSNGYQLFAFTSCGSYWEVYIAWNFLNTCFVEIIWEGDVKQFSRAYDLICIVDQIHDYAVNNHREFVMKHLEAWHARHEKTRQPHASRSSAETLPAGRKPMDGTSDRSEDESSESDGTDAEDRNKPGDVDADHLDGLMDLDTGLPEWFLLKQRSKWARQDKAQETRERNRKLCRSVPSLDTDSLGQRSNATTAPKRQRK